MTICEQLATLAKVVLDVIELAAWLVMGAWLMTLEPPEGPRWSAPGSPPDL